MDAIFRRGAARVVAYLLLAVLLASALSSLASPVPGQFGFAIGWGHTLNAFMHLDLGRSTISGLPVLGAVQAALWPTWVLAFEGLGAGALLGGLMGWIGSFAWAGVIERTLCRLLASMPPFLVPLLLLVVGARMFNLSPALVQGAASTAVEPLPSPGNIVTFLADLVPATLAAGLVARDAAASSLASVATAPWRVGLRRQGLSAWSIERLYVAPLVIGDTLRQLGPMMAAALGAASLVESVMRIPGEGALIIKSLALQDWPVAAGGLLAFAATAGFCDLAGRGMGALVRLQGEPE